MSRFLTQFLIAAGVVLGGILFAKWARSALRTAEPALLEEDLEDDGTRVNARNSGMIH